MYKKFLHMCKILVYIYRCLYIYTNTHMYSFLPLCKQKYTRHSVLYLAFFCILLYLEYCAVMWW